MVVSSSVGFACIWKTGRGTVRLSPLKKDRYLEILNENKNRWRANVVQGLVNAISLNALAHGCLLLGGKEAAGLFSFAQKILTVPVRLIGNSVRQVMLREYSLSGITASTVRGMTRLTGVLALVSLALFTTVGFAMPFLVDLCMDQQWAKVSLFVWPMSIWLGCTIVYTPTISALNAAGNNWPHAVYELVNMGMRVAAALVCSHVGLGAIAYVFTTSICSSALIVAFVFGVRLQLLKTVREGSNGT